MNLYHRRRAEADEWLTCPVTLEQPASEVVIQSEAKDLQVYFAVPSALPSEPKFRWTSDSAIMHQLTPTAFPDTYLAFAAQVILNKLVKACGRTLLQLTKYVEIRTVEQKSDDLPTKESKRCLLII